MTATGSGKKHITDGPESEVVSPVRRLLVGEEKATAHDSAGRVFIDRDPRLSSTKLEYF